jgi:hypothetical protein
MRLKDGKKASAAGLISAIVLAFCAVFSAGQTDAQVAASPGLKLIGTMEGTSLSGAVFQNAEGQQIFYQLYDKLPDGSKIIRLRDDSISIKGPDGAVYDMFIARDTRTPGSATARNNAPAPQPVVPQQQTSSVTATSNEEPSNLRRARPAGEKRVTKSPGRKLVKRPADSEE